MANINPQEIRDLATQLMQDSETINSLAHTMPGKVQRMEEGAAGLHAATSTSENLNQVMQALKEVAQGLESQRQFLQRVAQEMDNLINM